MSLCVTCGTSNGLDQGCLRTQKALLICIENCNKGDLRNIQSLPQKVNTDKHIEHIKTHIPDDLCPFQCINIRMQVLHTDSHILHIIGQVLSHPFRERRYQNLIMLLRFLPDLRNQIINLSFHRTDENLRIQKSRWPDNLLCAQQFMLLLIRGRGCRHEQHLVNMLLEFSKVQRPVIQCRWQTETIIHESSLPRTIPDIHRPDLWDRNMGLINNNEKIVLKII